MREQVEMLEHHAHLHADGVQLPALCVGDVPALELDNAACGLLEEVKAAQERTLTGA